MERRPAGHARELVNDLKAGDVSIVTAVPDSHFKSALRMIAADGSFVYVQTANEAEMPGIVAGAYLGGRRAVMMMENSGLRQACEPIARLSISHHMPMVMFLTYRGELGEPNWWGHSHARTMVPILDALSIPHWHVRKGSDIPGITDRAFKHADAGQWPVALIFGGECVDG